MAAAVDERTKPKESRLTTQAQSPQLPDDYYRTLSHLLYSLIRTFVRQKSESNGRNVTSAFRGINEE
jgi:hypothetical protein